MFGNGKRNRLFSRDLIWNDAPCDVDVFSAAEKFHFPTEKQKRKITKPSCLYSVVK